MGVNSADIFGGAASAEPATPGSYGVAPQGFRLPRGTRLGVVRLQVAHLSRSLLFYLNVLGLRVLRREQSMAVLGAQGDDTPIIALYERPGARSAAGGGRLGLYHFAILLPDRPALGRFLHHLADSGVRAGASDHLVSEAIYLHDDARLLEWTIELPDAASVDALSRSLVAGGYPSAAEGVDVVTRDPWGTAIRVRAR